MSSEADAWFSSWAQPKAREANTVDEAVMRARSAEAVAVCAGSDWRLQKGSHLGALGGFGLNSRAARATGACGAGATSATACASAVIAVAVAFLGKA